LDTRNSKTDIKVGEKRYSNIIRMLTRSNQQMELLTELTNRLLTSDKPETIVHELCQMIMSALDCHMFFNYLIDESKNCLHLNACSGVPDDVARSLEWLDYGDAVCGCVGRDGQRIVVENILESPDPRTELVATFGIQAFACHPLLSRNGKIIGTLSFATKTRPRFQDDELAFMKTVANHIALAMDRIQDQKAVRESEARLSTIVENLSEGLVVSDLQGNLIHWNHAALVMHGLRSLQESPHSLAEFGEVFELSDPDGRILPPEERPLGRILRGKPVQNMEYRIRRRDIDWQRTYIYSGMLIRDTQNQPQMAIITINDISEQKQVEKELRENQEDLNRAQAVAHIGSWRLNVRENKLHWSDQTYRMFGIPRGTPLTYQTFLDAVHPDDRRLVDERWNAAIKGEPYKVEHRIIVNGEVKWVREQAVMEIAPDGTLLGGFGTVQDITEQKQTEEILERYKLLAAHTRDIILFIQRQDGRIIEANTAAVQAYGYTREELLNLTIYDLRAPQAGGPTAEQIADADQKGILFQTVHQRKDKSTFPVEVSSRGETIAGKRMLISVIRDDTERKRAEEILRQSEERLKQAVRVSGLGIFEHDHITDIITPSPEHQNIWRLAPGETPSISVYLNHIHPDDRDRIDKAIRLAHDPAGNGIYDVEHRIIWPDGTVRWLSLKSITLFEGQGPDRHPVKTIGACVDITERKQAQEVLQQAKDELELRVRQRTAELQKANEELQRSNADLEQFAYVSSHDLQEPLRMVANFVQLLELKYKDRLDQEGREFIHFAVDGAKRMSNLIKDLLAYSRVNTRSTPPTQVNINSLLDSIFHDLRLRIKETGAQITVDPMPTIVADRTQLSQVFQNLIENALKFAHPGRSPQIHITAQRNEGEWQFSVRDNGIGIDPEFHDKVFIIFQRLHSDRTKFPGTGIGLAIVKRIIERHNGKIWSDSVPDQGTTFHFTIPDPK